MAGLRDTRIGTCDDEIDWEMIAESLSQCQPSKKEHSTMVQDQGESYKPSAQLPVRHNHFIPPAGHLPRDTAFITPTTITLAARADTQAGPSSTTTPSNPGLSTGAKAGIAGTVAIGVVVALATLITLHTRRRRKKHGYTKTKGNDVTVAELEGYSVSSPWPDHGEARPRTDYGYNRHGSDGQDIGLGLQELNGQYDYARDRDEVTGGSYNDVSQGQYYVSPELPQAERAHQFDYHPPSQQSYHPSPPLNTSEYNQQDPDPFEQHNKRARPSHPFSLLSEAIPPPKLEARKVHVMADYQNAVPLGFANGFVQVGSHRGTPEQTPESTWDSVQHTIELDLGDRSNRGGNSEEVAVGTGSRGTTGSDNRSQHRNVVINRHSGDNMGGNADEGTLLPQYEQISGPQGAGRAGDESPEKSRVRESVRWDQATGHYHIDSESDTEQDSSGARRNITKEERG